MLNRFGMASIKPICTPLTTFIHLTELNATQSKSEREYMSHVPYVSVVGSLMYVMVYTRPNLAQTVNVVSKYMGKLGKEHWQTVKCIFRYLKGTTDIGLVYQGDTSCALAGYSDSDYAIDLDARQSVTGYAFTIRYSLISWKVTLQSIIALSTTEVEYMALAEVTKEGIWLKGLISNLRFL